MLLEPSNQYCISKIRRCKQEEDIYRHPLFTVSFITMANSSCPLSWISMSHKPMRIWAERRMAGGSPPHPVVVMGLPVWLFLSHESSPTSSLRSQSQITSGSICNMKGTALSSYLQISHQSKFKYNEFKETKNKDECMHEIIIIHAVMSNYLFPCSLPFYASFVM